MKEDFSKKISDKEALILHGGKVGEFAKKFTGEIDYIGRRILAFAYGKHDKVQEKGVDFFDKYALVFVDSSLSSIHGYPELKVMGIDTSNILTGGFRRMETNEKGIWLTKLYGQRLALDFGEEIAKEIVQSGLLRTDDTPIEILPKDEVSKLVNIRVSTSKMRHYVDREIQGKKDYWDLDNMKVNEELFDVAKKDPVLQLVELLKNNGYDKEVINRILRKRMSEFYKFLFMNNDEYVGTLRKNDLLKYFNDEKRNGDLVDYYLPFDIPDKNQENNLLKEIKNIKGMERLDYYSNKTIGLTIREIETTNALIEEMCFRTNV